MSYSDTPGAQAGDPLPAQTAPGASIFSSGSGKFLDISRILTKIKT